MTSDQEQDVHHGATVPPGLGGPDWDLAGSSGLPIRLDPLGVLRFSGGLPAVTPQPRTIADMRVVLYNQTAAAPDEVYQMYRGLGWPEDLARLSGYALRFDLTVVTPGLIGGEYAKTTGHYHPGRYAEVYQVLLGQAHFLLQKPVEGDTAGRLEDVVVVEAGEGDYLYVPPGYGHVTINRGRTPLTIVNVVDRTFASVYGPYRERHGAAYYEIDDRGRAYWVANSNYPTPPEPRLGRVTAPADLGLTTDEPLYLQLVRAPRALAYLSQPPGDGPLP